MVARDVRTSSTLPQSFCPSQGPPSLGLSRGLELSRAESHLCEELDVSFPSLGRADAQSTAPSLRGAKSGAGRPVMVARLRGGAAFRCAGRFWRARVPAAGRRLASRGSVTYRLPAVRAYFDVLLEAVLFRIFQPSFHGLMVPLPVFI